MRTAKEYRRIAWNAIRPHWRAMLLISLAAVLPQLIEFFLQLLFGLIPPIDMQFWFSDPSRFLAAYDAFIVQTLAPNLLLNVLFNCLSVPLTLGLIGSTQRLLRGEDVQARHSLTYVPYSLRAIGLEIRIVLYAFWPLMALAAVTLVLLLIFHSHSVYQLFPPCLACGDCFRGHAAVFDGSGEIPDGEEPDPACVRPHGNKPHYHGGQAVEPLPAGIVVRRVVAANDPRLRGGALAGGLQRLCRLRPPAAGIRAGVHGHRARRFCG